MDDLEYNKSNEEKDAENEEQFRHLPGSSVYQYETDTAYINKHSKEKNYDSQNKIKDNTEHRIFIKKNKQLNKSSENESDTKDSVSPKKKSSINIQIITKKCRDTRSKEKSVESKTDSSKTFISSNTPSSIKSTDLSEVLLADNFKSYETKNIIESPKNNIQPRKIMPESFKQKRYPFSDSLRSLKSFTGSTSIDEGSDCNHSHEKVIEKHVRFPPKEIYEVEKLDWNKVYGMKSDELGQLKLISDKRHRTNTRFSKGGLETGDHPVGSMSDSELVSSGLQQIFINNAADNDNEFNKFISKFTNIIDSIQFSPTVLSDMLKYINQKTETAEKYENECKILLKSIKKILTEKTFLKRNINKLKNDILNFEEEFKNYPTINEVYDLKNCNQEQRDKIKTINTDYIKILQKLQTLENDIKNESCKYLALLEQLLCEIEDMGNEHACMENWVDNFSADSTIVHNVLIDKMNVVMKTITGLNDISKFANASIEENHGQISQMNQELSSYKALMLQIKNSLDNMVECYDLFYEILEHSESQYSKIFDQVKILERDLYNIYRNFDTIKGNLINKDVLVEQKKNKDIEINIMFNQLKNIKQKASNFEKEILKLEKSIQEEEMKNRNELLKYTQNNETQLAKDQNNWDQKISRLFDFIMEMTSIEEEAKAEEMENRKQIEEFLQQFDIQDSDQEMEKQDGMNFTRSFLYSDAATNGVVTIGGLNSVERAMTKDTRMDSSKLLHTEKARKTFDIGHLDLDSVPEFGDKIISGMYGKFDEKNTIDTEL